MANQVFYWGLAASELKKLNPQTWILNQQELANWCGTITRLSISVSCNDVVRQLNLFIFLNTSNLFVQFFSSLKFRSSKEQRQKLEPNKSIQSSFRVYHSLQLPAACSFQQLAAIGSCTITSQQPFFMHLGWFESTKEQLHFQKVKKLASCLFAFVGWIFTLARGAVMLVIFK